jgi:hypothetical protein
MTRTNRYETIDRKTSLSNIFFFVNPTLSIFGIHLWEASKTVDERSHSTSEHESYSLHGCNEPIKLKEHSLFVAMVLYLILVREISFSLP